ncbi:putative Major facilitator superfamily (MFS) profile domain-containing protein [Seiridium cardinale]
MEQEPFIQEDNRPGSDSPRSPPTGRINSLQHDRGNYNRSLLGCVFMLKFCIQFSSALLELPMVRLIEQIVCQSRLHIDVNSEGEQLCKVPLVQDKVASIIGFSDAIAWQNRTQLLSLMHASDAIAGLLAYPISSALMQYQLWAPFGLAVLVFILRYAVLSYMPESSPYFDQNATEADILLNPYEARRWEDREGDQSSLVPPKSLTTDAGRGLGSLFTAMRSSSLWSFFKHRGPNAIFGCFIGKRIAFSSEGFISQYASEILHKNISQTYWLRTFNYAGMLIVLGVILPLLSRCLANPTNELVVVRGSLVDLMVGFTILWRGRSLVALSTGLFICGFGEGLEVGLQSLGSYLVGEAHHATFFSFVSVLGVFGELLGGPVMAGVYAVRGQDSLPMGYCFLLSMVLFGGLLLASFLIQSSQNQREHLENRVNEIKTQVIMISDFESSPGQKTQPWRKHWPPPPSVDTTLGAGFKAGELLTVDGSNSTASFGYNDEGEAITGTPKPEKGKLAHLDDAPKGTFQRLRKNIWLRLKTVGGEAK